MAELDETRRNGAEICDGHVQGERLIGSIGCEIRRAVIRRVARGDQHGAGLVAHGQRYTGISRAALDRRDARHDLKRQAGFRQRLELLGGAAEDHRVAALETADMLA